MKRMGISNMKQMFNSFSGSALGYQPLKYYCMNCGTEHRETSCPRCGSKITRVG
jgi:rubrerythrin